MARVYNFAAGPATLPLEVLEEAQKELLDYENSGMSVMEMSHRSKLYQQILAQAEQDLRTILSIPNNYQVLFLQGGGHLQFSMIPLNLMKNDKADYILSGHWSKKAYEEGKKYGDCQIIASSEDVGFMRIPDLSSLKIRPDADYVYFCDNNTLYGTKFKTYPKTANIPLVSDMSSCFLSEEVDVSQFGLIFAGAQKNVGPAGVTIVIIRDDLIQEPKWFTPTMLQYQVHVKSHSLYNTPPTYGIYICGKVFQWILKTGGLKVRSLYNQKKAKLLYDYLDQSTYYKAPVEKESRSIMNVLFSTGKEERDIIFASEASQAGLVNLKGHRLTGGLRASIYNAMTIEGVEALIEFMEEFSKKHMNDANEE